MSGNDSERGNTSAAEPSAFAALLSRAGAECYGA